MSLKETVIKLTCVVLMLICFVQPVCADWYDDLKGDSEWVEIEGDNFVADTFMGVNALYNENNRNHQPNSNDQYIGMPPVPPPSMHDNPFPMGGMGDDSMPF